jgi:hypothetical protein
MGERGNTDRRARRARRRVTAAGMAAAVVVAAACTGSGGGGNDPAPGDGPAGDLSLLTYNVAGLPQEISSENPEQHLPLISPLLNDYDVVLTQEDFDWWQDVAATLDFVNYHDRLRADATHEHRSEPHPGPDAVGLDAASRPLQVGDGLGVLSRIPFTGNTRVPWTGCFGGLDVSDGGAGDCLAMKGFMMVTLTLADGIEVDLYNLHAEAGGTDEDQRLQAQGFDELGAFIEERSAGRAIVLGGDTNLHTAGDHPDATGGADAEIWDGFLARTGLVDACAAIGCADPGMIDKVAYRGGEGVALTAVSHDVPRERFRSPAGDDLSDHPPVVVELTWEVGG